MRSEKQLSTQLKLNLDEIRQRLGNKREVEELESVLYSYDTNLATEISNFVNNRISNSGIKNSLEKLNNLSKYLKKEDIKEFLYEAYNYDDELGLQSIYTISHIIWLNNDDNDTRETINLYRKIFNYFRDKGREEMEKLEKLNKSINNATMISQAYKRCLRVAEKLGL